MNTEIYNFMYDLFIILITFTCVGVFIATSIAVVLDLFGKIQLESGIRKKLHHILLIEVIAISIPAFSGFLNPQKITEKFEAAQNSNEISKKNADLFVANAPARVYIQIASEEQRNNASKLQVVLKEKGFIVPSIENVSGKTKIPSSTSIRYFNELDVGKANDVLNMLKEQGITSAFVERVKGYSVSIGTIEVWFSK